MSKQSLQILETIKLRLKRTAKRRYLTHIVFGTVLLIGIISGFWLLFTVIEAGFWLNSSFRLAAFVFVLALSAATLGWFVVLPFLRYLGTIRGASDDNLAQDIGRKYPQISDRLLNLLNIAEGKRSASPNSFVDHAVFSLSEQIGSIEFEKMENFDRAIRAFRYALVPLLGIIVFLIAAPTSFIGASQRLLDPGTEFLRPAPFHMQISPGSVELIRGDSLQVTVSLEGSELPDALTLRVRNDGEEKILEEQLTVDSAGIFKRTFVNVRRSFVYNLSADPVTSPWYDVHIVERPIIRSLQVSLEFPRYSRIPPQRLDPNVGDVQALPGTRVKLEAMVGGPDITQAFVVYDNDMVDTLTVNTNQASGEFILTREGSYHIRVEDAKGTVNSDPIRYSLKLLQDALPTAVLISPPPLAELDESLNVPLRARITDDFGFSKTRLFYRLSETRFGETMPSFESMELPLQSFSELDQEILFDWDLTQHTDLDPVPGDAIEYYIQVWDNDAFAGYKFSKSSTQILRLPSLAEQYKNLEQQEDDTQEEMEDLLRDTRNLEDQFRELQDELRNKLESDWEDQRQLEQIKEKQAELESRVESLNESFENMTQQMEDNNLVSEETQQLYEEMQEVLEEINSPELMEALNELQKAMQELNLQQMQESLNNFQFNEEQYQQRLERTLELFKQLRVQQDLEEVAKRAEELAKQQEQLQEETEKLENEEKTADSDAEKEEEQEMNESTEKNPSETDEEIQGEEKDSELNEAEQNNYEQKEGVDQEGEDQENENQSTLEEEKNDSPQEELAKKQELSREEMEELEEKLDQIQERMEELQNAPSEDMQQLNQTVQEQQLPEQMQRNAEQLRQNELNQAQQLQQQMQQQLQQMQQGMQGAQMQLNLAGLRRALSDILTLSQLQEELRENLRELSPDSPTMRQLAQEQVELSSGLRVVSDSLQKLSQKIPQMSREVQQHAGDALREMNSSVESMTDRVASRASGHQKESMMHLNELALLLSDLLNEMMNQQGSGGGGMSMQQMIEQLQNAAGQQQKLNQQIQQMLNEMQGNRLSQDMQQRLRQMAAQQEQIRSQIKQLGRNRELRRDLMGDLNRIAEQMQETIRELQRSRPNRRTVERQQQILTRLLEATKSMQERGREKRREGRVAEELYRESPDAITPSEKADQLRRALIEALESGYAPDYEELIKHYFELLQERSLEETQ